MWGLIVVLGLVAVVVLVGVLVALGMRASRSGGDDDWMAEDEQQPRGRRGGRSRGRRGDEELPEEEPYGDMRVAGNPIPQHGSHHQQLPAAPAPLPAPAPSAPVPAQSGRSSDEMDDDEYWSTITFDKPRFPWRQNAEQQADERGHDPLGPAAGQGPPGPPLGPGEQIPIEQHPAPIEQHPAPIDQHPLGYIEQNPVGPLDSPAPPTAPQPAVPASPLDRPMGRPNETDPGALPAYGSAEQSGSYAPYAGEQQGGYGNDQHGGGFGSDQHGYGTEQHSGGFGNDQHGYGTEQHSGGYGIEQQSGGYGDDPLNTGERPSYGSLPPAATPPPPSPAPQAPAPASMSSAGNDDNRLPSVDELLAKIQSDRKRATPETESPSAPSQPSFDVNDPLNTGERQSYRSSYGSSSPSTPSSGSWSSDNNNYGSDPLSSGSYPSSGGYGSSSYDSGSSSSSGSGGYGSSSSNYSSGSDYSSSSSSSSSQQDDPLGTGYSGSSYGSKNENSTGGYSSGNYGSQSSSSGGYDSGYYNTPQPGQGYEPPSTTPRPEDNATQAYPTSPYGNSYGSENRDDKDKRPEDWNSSYGDYRH